MKRLRLGITLILPRQPPPREETKSDSTDDNDALESPKRPTTPPPAIKSVDVAECAICFEAHGAHRETSIFACNRHIFHTECIRAWLDKGKSDCPVCRFSTKPKQ